MRQRFQSGDRIYEIEIERTGDTYQASTEGQILTFEVLDMQAGLVSLRIQGKPATIYWAADDQTKWLSMSGCTYRLERPRPVHVHSTGEAAAGETVRSPMPAQVRAVLVEEGQVVEAGQTLLLLEAMKMEIRVRATSAGRITRLLVIEGQAVLKEQVLVEMEG